MFAFPKLAALTFAAALFTGTPARAIDPFFPSFGNNGFNVIHYDLDLKVTPATGRLDAGATLWFIAETRLTTFSLDLHGLTVSKVTLWGIPAQFSQANDKLIIRPRLAIPKGAVIRADIAYAGTPTTIQDPTVPGDPEFQLGWFRYFDASYVVSEPVGASTFYPANDEPDDKATFKIAVTVPAAYTAASNGALAGVRAIGMNKRFEWAMRQPMTTWLATVHINKFTLNLTRAADGTPIRVYSTAATPAFHVPVYALAGAMLTYFERLIGQYPFDSYGSVVVDDPVLYYALETQAMSTFATPEDPTESPDEATVAHELAHQWFGNSVSIKRWEDLWLAEGAATYFEILWMNRGDLAAFEHAMAENYAFVVSEAYGPAVVSEPELMFELGTYLRGAATFYALRQTVGDRTFFRILSTFLHLYRGGNATSADFIRTAVFVSGKPSVAPMLRAWLYDEAVPPMPGISIASARSAPVAPPDVFALRCGRGSHRGSAAHCN